MLGRELISYVRVSAAKQGRSGLGIEEQRAVIERFAQAEGCVIRRGQRSEGSNSAIANALSC